MSKLASPYKVTWILLFLAAGASGAAALIYQVVWNRQLLMLFGSTTSATSTVIAAFIGGIALGTAFINYYLPRINRGHRLYAFSELAIVGSAFILTILLPWLFKLYAGLWLSMSSDWLAAGFLRLFIGLLVLLLPTFLMGVTLPLLANIFESFQKKVYENTTKLYAINALGGAIGATLAGFIILPYMGIEVTYYVAFGFNLIAATLVFLSKKSETLQGSLLNSSTEGFIHKKQIKQVTSRRVLKKVTPFALVLSGITGLAYEVLWTRTLVLLIGSSTYAFSLIIIVYILAIAVGSYAMSKKIAFILQPKKWFIAIQFLIAAFALLGTLLLGYMPLWSISWFQVVGASFNSTLLLSIVFTMLIVFPPALLLGASFPLSMRLMTTGSHSVSQGFSQAYIWIAIGNILGAFVAGLGLITLLGLQTALLVMAAVNILAGCILIDKYSSFTKQDWSWGIGFIAAFIALFAISPRWDPLLMTSGLYQNAAIYMGMAEQNTDIKKITGAFKLRQYVEGEQSIVTVVERPTLRKEPHLVLTIDGKVDASNGKDMSTQILSAHIPLKLNKNPENILVIGLASGVTVGSITQSSKVKNIAVAEIEPAVVKAANEFRRYNHNALEDPRVNLILDDGRHHLSVSNVNYDVIISEPSNPWLSGPSRLFTYEFFLQAASRLSQKGVFAQWIQLYGISTELLKTEIRTFLKVFPYVHLYQVSAGDLLIVGSLTQLSRDTAPESEKMSKDLQRIDKKPSELMSHFITARAELATWVNDGVLNTDNRNLLEFEGPKLIFADSLAQNQQAINSIPWQGSLTTLVGDCLKCGITLSKHYLQTEQLEKASYLINALMEKDKASSQLLEMSGLIESKKGNWIQAEQHWKNAQTQQSWFELTKQSLLSDDLKTAKQRLAMIKDNFDDPEYFYWSSILHMKEKSAHKALNNILSYIKLSPSPRLLSFYMAQVLLTRTGEFTKSTDLNRLFLSHLDEIRYTQEFDEHQSEIIALIEEIEEIIEWRVFGTNEIKALQLTIQRRILDPLTFYYNAVRLMWGGDDDASLNSFEKYIKLLPKNSGKNRAKFWLSKFEQPNLINPNQ